MGKFEDNSLTGANDSMGLDLKVNSPKIVKTIKTPSDSAKK
jgi:hypothetical protein